MNNFRWIFLYSINFALTLFPGLMLAIQTPESVFMVKPSFFEFNTETAECNLFQNDRYDMTSEMINEKAYREFDNFVSILREGDVDVHVGYCQDELITPDAHFPNNWFSVHRDLKTLVLYPMKAPNRRLERRMEFIDYLIETCNIEHIVDISPWERKGLFLEGTGSIAFDTKNAMAYACLSPRTSLEPLEEVCRFLDCDIVTFKASDRKGIPIYHTNVCLCIAENYAIICLDAIEDPHERTFIHDTLIASGHEVIDISFDQLDHFCGNVLEVKDKSGKLLSIMSEQAYSWFTEEQIAIIEKSARIIKAPLYTIESIGGGSARCMLGGF